MKKDSGTQSLAQQQRAGRLTLDGAFSYLAGLTLKLLVPGYLYRRVSLAAGGCLTHAGRLQFQQRRSVPQARERTSTLLSKGGKGLQGREQKVMERK